MAIPLLPYSDSSMTIPLVADFVTFSYSDICSPFNQGVYCAHLLDVIIIPMTVPRYCNISLFLLLLNKKASLQCYIIRSLFHFALFFYSIYFPLFIRMAMPFLCWCIAPPTYRFILFGFPPRCVIGNYGNVTSFLTGYKDTCFTFFCFGSYSVCMTPFWMY